MWYQKLLLWTRMRGLGRGAASPRTVERHSFQPIEGKKDRPASTTAPLNRCTGPCGRLAGVVAIERSCGQRSVCYPGHPGAGVDGNRPIRGDLGHELVEVAAGGPAYVLAVALEGRAMARADKAIFG